MSIEESVKRYGQMIYRLALSRLGNREDAEDVTQEVFMRLLRQTNAFVSAEHEKAWLLRVTINTSINYATTAYRRHHASFTDELAAVTADPNSVVYEGEDEALLLMQQLPAKYRQALHLFYYEELSVAEIATVLGSKEGTVKSLLHRGRNKLKLLWEGR